jgi:hypothetical protein
MRFCCCFLACVAKKRCLLRLAPHLTRSTRLSQSPFSPALSPSPPLSFSLSPLHYFLSMRVAMRAGGEGRSGERRSKKGGLEQEETTRRVFRL